MVSMRNLLRTILWLLGALAGLRLTFAYIDPNTGGFIFQLLAVIFASLTGILLYFSRQIRITVARIKRMRSGSSSSSEAQDSTEPGSPPAYGDNPNNT
jgi:hypothetical protein